MCLAKHVSVAGERQFPKRRFEGEELRPNVLIAEDDFWVWDSREEVSYRFADQPMPAMTEKVLNFAAEAGKNLRQDNAGFLAQLADRGCESIFSGLDVTLGEAPMPSVVKQQICKSRWLVLVFLI
jgi:hypothetical protein